MKTSWSTSIRPGQLITVKGWSSYLGIPGRKTENPIKSELTLWCHISARPNVSYPDSLDTTYGHMYALFTEERNECIDLDCLTIVLLAYMCCPSIFLLSKMIEIKEHN